MTDGTAEVTFHPDWRVEQSGPLVAGARVRIRYARDRLLSPQELEPGGPNNVMITGFYRIDDGPPEAFPVGGRPSGRDHYAEHAVTLPQAARRIELWFQRATLYGDERYDSNFGGNYQMAVLPRLDLTEAVVDYVAALTRAPGTT